MKVSFDGRQMDVDLRCRNWDVATQIALHNKALPPDGYKLISTFTRDRSKSGARATLSMRFMKVDRGVEDFNQDEAFSFFQEDADVANGTKSYAPYPDPPQASEE